jgi:phytoene desaturase
MIAAERSLRHASDVGIVGAGPGGLATAILLAASGASVDVYERQPVVGGRTRRLSLGDHHFDLGPTFFMMPYVLDEILAAAGRKLSDQVEMTRLDPMYRLLLGQPERDPITLDTTQDLALMSERLSRIEPHDGPAFLRFIADNRRKLEAMTPILRRPMRSVLDLVSRDAMQAAPHLRPWQSLYDHLKGYFRNPSIRLSMSFQSKYLGMSPYECPELFSILPFIEYEYGIWHPTGGCNAVMRAMADIAEELGVRFHLGRSVDAIEFEGRRAVGVHVDGALRRHGNLVLNADATHAMRTLVPAHLRRRWSDERIDRSRYSCSTAMLYLGVDGEVDLPHHTIYVSRQYERNLADIARNGTLSEDPSMYACNPAATDPTMAPKGCSSLYVLLPTPNVQPGSNKVDWSTDAAKVRESTMQQLETVFGIPDIRRRIRVERQVTPLDWQAEGIQFGATFNLAHGLKQMLHRRPHHQLQDVDGVWLVGGGTHPGSGLPVIFLSAQITARLLCQRMGLPCAIDQPPASSAMRSATLGAWTSPTAAT